MHSILQLFFIIPALSVMIDSSKADVFNDYFHSVFRQDSCHHSSFNVQSPTNSLSKIFISDVDAYKVLVTLDTAKATGLDEIPPIVLSTCASAPCKPLHHLFCHLPYDCTVHKVVPIFKSSDHNLIKNYHLISLFIISNTSKVLQQCLIYNKIMHRVNSYIKPVQFVFMSNRSTTYFYFYMISSSHHQIMLYTLILVKPLTQCHIFIF